MAHEDIPTALRQFGQIDSALNRKYEGTGLGLPLTKALIEMHGGALELESRLGEGTPAILRLPAWRIVASPAHRQDSKAGCPRALWETPQAAGPAALAWR